MEQAEPITTWAGIQKLYEKYWVDQQPKGQDIDTKLWVFRGEDSDAYDLTPVLEREACRLHGTLSGMRKHEEKVLSEFKRHYHQFGVNLPDRDDDFRWLALLRHYRGPTRLLDFTYSFWIALYFAVESCKPPSEKSEKGAPGSDEEGRCAIWAIDHDALVRDSWVALPKELQEAYCEDAEAGKQPRTAQRFLAASTDTIWPLNPYHIDDRLSVQQGLFFMPLTLDKKFKDVLNQEQRPYVRRHTIHVSRPLLAECLNRLHSMNVTQRSLFPGVDGLAYGLRHRMARRYLDLKDELCKR